MSNGAVSGLHYTVWCDSKRHGGWKCVVTGAGGEEDMESENDAHAVM